MQITPTKLLSALCIYVGAAMNPSYSIYGRDTKLSCGGGEIHDSEREGGKNISLTTNIHPCSQ